jgi:hypothetical protein
MTGNLPSDASPFQNGKDHPIKTIKDKQKMEMKLKTRFLSEHDDTFCQSNT